MKNEIPAEALEQMKREGWASIESQKEYWYQKEVRERFGNNYMPEPYSGCWIWTGAIRNSCGYGSMKVHGKSTSASRLSYELHIGKIPDQMYVCHKCDSPMCVNPAHLFLGTAADNAVDRTSKGRSAFGEENGNSRLSESQVISIRNDTRSEHKIADSYGVSRSCVNHIKSGRHWGWLKEENLSRTEATCDWYDHGLCDMETNAERNL